MKDQKLQIIALDEAYRELKGQIKLRWKWLEEKESSTLRCLPDGRHVYGYIDVSEDGWYEIYMWERDNRMQIKVPGHFRANAGQVAREVLLAIDRAVCRKD